MNKKIQILRGLAIISVVIIHTNMTGMAGVLNRPFLNYAVAFFIFISGYLTKLQIPNYLQFIRRRLIKVIVPYTIWSIIYEMYYGTMNNFFTNYITARSSFILYYVFIYIIFVLITPLINKLILSKYSWVGWLVTPISLILTRYGPIIFNYSMPYWSSSFLFTNWFIFYYIGLFIGNEKIRIKYSINKLLMLYVICINISIFEGILWYKYGNYDLATTQLRITSMITSLGYILIASKYIKSNYESKNKIVSWFEKCLVYLGDCSFGIYLSHIIILNILNKYNILNNLTFPFYSFAVLILSSGFVVIGKKLLTTKYSWILGL